MKLAATETPIVAAAPSGRRAFSLLRYLSIASLIAIVLAAGGLAFFYRQTALKQVVKLGEDNNVALAQALTGTLRPYYAPLIDIARLSGGQTPAPRLAADLHQTVLDTVRESRVLKVRIYDPAGRTIYSSDARGSAADERAAPGFSTALAGGVHTSLNHPDTFDAFGLLLTDRSVLTMYVPVRRAAQGEIEAVLELASDVSSFYGEIRSTQTELRFGAALVVVFLYGSLFFAARRADRVIRAQQDQRQRDADTIRHLAHHDELTGLPNRKLFADRLSCALARASRSGAMAALMFIDLDRFKEVNDTFGHATGDHVLRAAGTLLRDALRTSDTVARMGGDEFTIILEDVADLECVETVAEKIRTAFAAPVVSRDGVAITVTPSMGIALYPLDGDSPDDLLIAADTALYDAKAAGRNAWRFYGGKPALSIEPVASETA